MALPIPSEDVQKRAKDTVADFVTYCKPARDAKVGKMEALREDLLRLFSECVEVPSALREALEELPPQNTSRHAHYSTYYDDELRAIVREKDAPVFDYFGYEWEEAPPDATSETP